MESQAVLCIVHYYKHSFKHYPKHFKRIIVFRLLMRHSGCLILQQFHLETSPLTHEQIQNILTTSGRIGVTSWKVAVKTQESLILLTPEIFCGIIRFRLWLKSCYKKIFTNFMIFVYCEKKNVQNFEHPTRIILNNARY